VLFGKFSSAISVMAKDKCWADVAALVTAASGINRSAAEVKKKWSCMKSEAKTCTSAARRSHTQTGGGPKSEEVDGQKLRIISLIGEVCVAGVDRGVDTATTQLQSLLGMCTLYSYMYRYVYTVQVSRFLDDLSG